MKLPLAPALVLLTLPLGAQAWDIRAEVPFASGQSLPQTFLSGTQQLVSGTLDRGSGSILTLSHRIIRIGPVLKFEWNSEVVNWQAIGQVVQGGTPAGSTLTQKGIGFGVNAQLWVPFTGLGAEVGVMERFHSYSFQSSGVTQDENLIQPWLRIGIRWALPTPGISPYLCASYQQPLTKSNPLVLGTSADLEAYFTAQGSGQQFDRVWTFGVGLMF